MGSEPPLHGLQLHDDEATQLEVIEEQIDPEILVSDFERDLTADEREAGAQLEEELLDVPDE